MVRSALFLFSSLGMIAGLLIAPIQAIGQSDGDCEAKSGLAETECLAEQGHPDAQYTLGVIYANGEGVPQDDAAAAEWFHKAAEQGDAPAQYNLGVLYANGWGVPQDDAAAAEWFRKAAEQGSAPAQSNLGLLYADGRGVPQDYVQSHMWLNLAASRMPAGDGREGTVQTRDRLAELMSTEQIAEAQRLARNWEPVTE